MKITGSTQIDLSLTNYDLSNFDYALHLNTKNNTMDTSSSIPSFEFNTKKENKKTENTIGVESNLGPINFKLNFLTEKDRIPEDLDDLKINLFANYKIDENLNIGLKYETDANQDKFEILSGTMDTNLNLDNFDINLSTENIIYGYENKDDIKVNLFGNKIKPSLGFMDKTLEFGMIYDQKEKIDEYGNKSEDINNKLCFDLNLKF